MGYRDKISGGARSLLVFAAIISVSVGVAALSRISPHTWLHVLSWHNSIKASIWGIPTSVS